MSTTHCAAISAELNEPPTGTAPFASAWLCLEQPGPWGPHAVLDNRLGAALARRAAGTGVRILLIRRTGRHVNADRPGPRRVYLASTRPGSCWLEQGTVADHRELLDLDLDALGAGKPLGFGVRGATPLLLVCTNGRRDLCCALRGRPIAGALAKRQPDRVWECTHTGGHRFAPTAVLLPTGYLYGRVDVGFADGLLHTAALNRVVIDRCRGRSCWRRHGQTAELAVRELTGERADMLQVLAEQRQADQAWTVPVRHRDGRQWQVKVMEQLASTARPESCGGPPVVPTTLVVSGIE